MIRLLVFLLLLISSAAHAYSVVVPDDKDYFINKTEKFNYIYPEEYRSLMSSSINLWKEINQEYEESYQWVLDEKTSLIYTSNYNQVANAFATVIPHTMNSFYNGGAAHLDSMAIRSWLFTLMLHEGAHIYQLNPKRGVSKFYHQVLGNSYVPILLTFIPIFIHPNAFLPSWILEGNSVLNESRFGNGGRLYSGEARAMFYSLLNANKITESNMTNAHLGFPFGYEKYIVGGYFNLYLATKYGVDSTNYYFWHHADQYINPFNVGKSFIKNYGRDYSQTIFDFVTFFKKRSQRQSRATGKVLTKSYVQKPMHRQNGEVIFLTSNYKSYPQLVTVDISTEGIKKEKLDVPLGKVFKLKDNKHYSLSSGLIDKKRIYYSLWGEGNRDLKKYRSKIITDMRKGKVLWIDPQKSFDEAKLYLNKRFVDTINSSALLDEKGNVYYFKQKEKTRTLYKNKKRLFSFESYYGKVVDIDESGTIYFIASTEYGSTLFAYDGKTINRVSSSDVIVDAKKLKGNRALVAEVTAESYEYKVIVLSSTKQLPFVYKYFFEKEKEFNMLAPISEQKKVGLDSEKDYGLFSGMRFSGAHTTISYSYSTEDGMTVPFAIRGLFADPLDHHNINLNLINAPMSDYDEYSLAYTNKKYLLNYYVMFTRERNYPTGYNYYENSSEVGLIYPIIKTRSWQSSFIQGAAHNDYSDLWGSYSALVTNWKKSFPLLLNPFRQMFIQLEHLRDQNSTYESSAYAKWGYDLGYEFILNIDGVYKRGSDWLISLDRPIRKREEPIMSSKFSIFPSRGESVSGGRLGTSLTKVINYGFYFETFPVSLRRWAPKVAYNHFYYQQNGKHDFQEFGFGVDFELLILHMFPLVLDYTRIKTEDSGWDLNVALSYKFGF